MRSFCVGSGMMHSSMYILYLSLGGCCGLCHSQSSLFLTLPPPTRSPVTRVVFLCEWLHSASG